MMVQYNTRDQADHKLAEIVENTEPKIQGKLTISDRSCFQYVVETDDVTDNVRYHLMDPFEKKVNMSTDQGNAMDYWFTGRWAIKSDNTEFKLGQYEEIGGLRLNNAPLEWVINKELFITPEGYQKMSFHWLERVAPRSVGELKHKRKLALS